MNIPPAPPCPPDFQFSQASLQDYVDCPRRFMLRYLLRLPWPAPSTDSPAAYEQQVHDGEAFHTLVHRRLLGLPVPLLTASAGPPDGPVRTWWDNYLRCTPGDIPGARRYPEIALAACIGRRRLIAKYDLLSVTPDGCALIFDWKTGKSAPPRDRLAARLQTRVYRYALLHAGSSLKGGRSFAPAQIQMVYWFATAPDKPETFAYDDVQADADGKYLASLVEEVSAARVHPSTEHERNCGYCVYRSLCGQGNNAATLDAASNEAFDEMEDILAGPKGSPDLDFEQIGEIAF